MGPRDRTALRHVFAMLVVAVEVCACQPQLNVDLSALSEDRSTILVFAPADSTKGAAAYAIDTMGGSAPLGFVLSDADKRAVVALGFDESLAEFGMEPGAVDISGKGPVVVRAADLVERAWSGAAGSSALTEWVRLDGAPPEFADVQLPLPDWSNCVDLGGCPLSGGTNLCTLPCPSSAAIEAPERPRFTCRPGWQEVTGAPDGVTTCRPENELAGEGEPGIAPCEPGQYRFFGQPACESVVSAPPIDGRWPVDLPADAIYVEPGVCVSGTDCDVSHCEGEGTRVAPYRSIAAALCVLNTGVRAPIGDATIALSTGDHLAGSIYRSTVATGWRRGIRMIGAGPGRTRVGAGAQFGLLVTTDDVEVRDLAVVGDGDQGLRVDPGLSTTASVALRNLRIEGADVGFAVEFRTGRIHARDIVVRGGQDAGVVVRFADATFERAVFDGSFRYGIRCDSGDEDEETPLGRLVLREVVVRGTRRLNSRSTGVDAEAGCSLIVERSRIVDMPSLGIFSLGASSVRISDTVFEGQPVGVSDAVGIVAAISLRTTEEVNLAGVAIAGSTTRGIIVCGSEDCGANASRPAPDVRPSVSIVDTVVRGVAHPDPGSGFGTGIETIDADITMSRTLVDGAKLSDIELRCGAFAGCSRIRLSDIVVRGGPPHPTDLPPGVYVDGTKVTLERILVAGSDEPGVQIPASAADEAAPAGLVESNVLRDITVLDTLAQGVLVAALSPLDMNRVHVERASGVGIDIDQSASGFRLSGEGALISHVLVTDTRQARRVVRNRTQKETLDRAYAVRVRGKMKSFELADFRINGGSASDSSSTTGIELELDVAEPELLSVHDGRIEGTEIGIRILSDVTYVAQQFIQRVVIVAKQRLTIGR